MPRRMTKVGGVLLEPRAHVTKCTYLLLWAVGTASALGGIALYLVQPTGWTWWASGVLMLPAGWLLSEFLPDSLGGGDPGPAGPP